MYDVVIVGAGASGLVCAIVSARRGKKVLILERNSKIGKKILATGNGRCNITNQRPNPDRFYSHNPKFIREALEGYGYQKVKNFFKSIGLELVEAKEGKVFPMSLQASSVVALLEAECEQLSVKIECGIEVNSIVNNFNSKASFYHVNSFEKSYKSSKVVIATGSNSAPQLGGVELGLTLAKSLGHHVNNLSPTLVQLTSPFKNLKEISGVKVESRVSFYSHVNKKTFTQKGDVLFTSYGISGLAILDISRSVIEELIHTPKVELKIDLMPKMSCEQLTSLMKKSLQKKSKKKIDIWLQGFINKKLILAILKPLKLENETVGSIESNIKNLDKIIHKIKNFSFIVDGDRGFKGAEVTAGGVDTREVNPLSMESKKQKGIYLTGEVLDVDGDRGGFNLHFAWICGIKAGENI